MRTAVVRVNVDPHGELSTSVLRVRMDVLTARAKDAGMELVHSDLDSMPANRRELQFLVVGDGTGDEALAMRDATTAMCAQVFGTAPRSGTVTYISRGTDDDALGVLAGFGITGQVERTAGADGLDVVTVSLDKADVERVAESRIHTALEASLNCEVRLVLT
jgi:hypothetical protein